MNTLQHTLKNRPLSWYFGAVICLLSWAAPSEAAVRTWNGSAGDSSWGTKGNWVGNSLPGPNDDVVFNSTAASCSLSADVTVKTITFTTGYTGQFSFRNRTLTVNGAADFRSGGTINAGTGQLRFNANSVQTFTPQYGGAFPTIRQDGSGTTTISTNGLTANQLILANGTFNLGAGLTHVVTGVSGTSPPKATIDFGSSTLQVTSGNADFTTIAVTAGTGMLSFTGTAAQQFTPKAGAVFPSIRQGGPGGTTVVTRGFRCGNLVLLSGAFNLGAGLQDTALNVTGTGGIDFSGATLTILGDTVNLGSAGALSAGSGALRFAKTSGTQVLLPKPGATHPAVVHVGAAVLQLLTNDLSTLGFTQSAGVLDFNGRNITTVSGGGFSITNGTTTTFSNLGGRTITVAGSAGFTGQSGNLLNMNPGSAWTVAATGGLQASYATIANSGASVSPGTATGSVDGGGNTGWDFVTGIGWDGGGGNTNWSTAANWSGDVLPGPDDTVSFTGSYNGNCVLDINDTVKAIIFSGSYTGQFSFGTETLMVSSKADFRTGGTITGTSGALALEGGSVNLYPKGGATFPGVVQRGSGGATIVQNGLTCNSLTIQAGTLALGTGLTHSTGTIQGSGSLDFGSSTLQMTGAIADFSSFSAITAGTGQLQLTGSTAHALTPGAGGTLPALLQNGSGATTIQANGLDAISLTVANGTVNLGTGLTHTVGDLTSASPGTGALNFGSSLLQITGNADLTSIGITAGTGSLAFTGASPQLFVPRAATILPPLAQNGAGGTTITTRGFRTTALTLAAGTLCLGWGVQDTVTRVTGSGNLDFGSATLTVVGDTVNLGSIGTLSAGTGTLRFEGTSGTQLLIPKTGATHPAVVHSGAATLRLSTNDLTANSYANTAGILDLNGVNIATVSGGNFTVTNGTTTTFSNLGGRTITVAGNASLGGQSGNLLNLNPGSGWNIAATGSLQAVYATVANSNASVAPGVATNSIDGGGNTNWGFSVVKVWDGGGGNTNWSRATNWSEDVVPGPTDTVRFDNTTTKNCNLDASATVAKIVCTSGYTGTFDFGSSTLSVSGTADFRTGGAITAGTGALQFTGSSGQTFYPKSGATFPTIIQNGGGGVTISGVGVTSTGLTISSGTLALGNGLRHTAAAISGTGDIDFGTSCTLQVSGATVDFSTFSTIIAGSGQLRFTGTTPQAFTPKLATTFPAIVQAGSGGTTIQTNGLTAGALTVASGTLNLGSGLIHSVTSITSAVPNSGSMDFGSSDLRVTSDNAVFTNISVIPGSGTLTFTGTGPQQFTPRANAIFPAITQNGSGGTTVETRGFRGGILTLTSGTFNLGPAILDTVTKVAGSGNLNFNSATLTVLGDTAGFGSVGTLTAGTGTLRFAGVSGTQVLVPKAGVTHPAVVHSGAATLRVSTNDLTANSFTNSGGALDLNGRNITTVSGGDFTILNGTATTLSNLGGRLITVAGNASLAGQNGNLLNLNPPSAWTIAATGSLQASYATVANGNASVTAGAAANSVDGGGNTSWSFSTVKVWDGGGGDAKWSTPANWTDDAAPTATDAVQFSGTFTGDCNLDASDTVAGVVFTSGYTGIFNFSAGTLTVTGTADFRTGGTITAATGALQFAGSSGQTFYPKSGAAFPGIIQNGSGGTTISGAGLSAGGMTITSGILNLGSGLKHTVTTVSGAGGIDFGTSCTLQVSGATADFSSFSSFTGGSGQLRFTGPSAQTFAPKSGIVFPDVVQAGPGGTTIQTDGLTAGSLTIASGTLNLGSGLTHAVSLVGSGAPNAGGINFGSSALYVSGSTADFSSIPVTAGSGQLRFTGSSAQTFTPKSGATFPAMVQAGSGGTTIQTNDLNAGALTIASGTLDLGSGLTHAVASVANAAPNTGSLDFGTSTLEIAAGDANFLNIGISAGGGMLRFTGTSAQLFAPRAGAIFPDVTQDGPGGTTVISAGLRCDGLVVASGIFDLGAGLLDTLASLSGSGDLYFNSAMVTILGDTADFGSIGTLAAGTGTIRFAGSAGTQVLVPKPGETHPAMVHSGAATLRLLTNDLTVNSFTNGAGVLDLNGRNITTVSGGDFVITNGGSTTLSNLDGRTIMVAGDASLSGQAGNYLNLNPGLGWTIAVTGTLQATYATIGNSLASVSTGGAAASTDAGGNTNWFFAGSKVWDGGGADGNWSTAANWSGDAVPSAFDSVLFDGTHVGNCSLDTDQAVAHVFFSSAYTGTFSFVDRTLTITGTADFRSGGPISAGTGTLRFSGISSQMLYPKPGATFPTLVQDGSGGTTIASVNMTAGNLVISGGSLNLGSGRKHTMANVSGSGSLSFGTTCTLQVTGASIDFGSLNSITAGNGVLRFTGTAAQNFTPASSASLPSIVQGGAGGTTIVGNDMTAGTLILANGTLNLGSGLSHSVSGVTAASPNTGSLSFGSSTLRVASGNADFTNITVATGTGALSFSGSSAQQFTPRAGATFPTILQNGAGGTTVVTRGFRANSLTSASGTFNLGTGLQDTVLSKVSGTGNFSFGSATLVTLGDTVDFGLIATLTPGTGTLAFASSSLNQVLIPKAGVTHPAISHAGAATLRLSSNNLIARSFTQSAGILDLNGRDITTVSAGDFTIANGSSGSVTGLGGRTITVAGNAGLNGQNGNLLNLDPVSGWTIAVTGSLQANYAIIANSNASVSAGSALHSIDGGGNTNWAFVVLKFWDGGGGDNNWNTAANWSDDALPIATDTVQFDDTYTGNCNLDADDSVAKIVFTPQYTGTFSFTTRTLTVNGTADFRSGGVLSAGTGALRFGGASAQTFYPKTAASFPVLIQEGSGGTTIAGANLTAGALSLLGGVLNLGTGLKHTVTGVSGTGGIDFGTSCTLQVTGAAADFGSLGTIAAGSGVLRFAGASVQSFTPKSGATFPAIVQAGAGTTTVLAAGLTSGILTISNGAFSLGSGLSHSVAAVGSSAPATGSLQFGSSTLSVSSGNGDFTNIAVAAGTGRLVFAGNVAQAFYPRSGATFPDVEKTGGGTATIASQNLLARDFVLSSGTLNLGAGLTHTVRNVSGSGNIDFGSSTLQVNGNSINVGSVGTLTPGTGVLQFTGATGTAQVFTPHASTNPSLSHTGADTLRLSTNDLSARSFVQSAGVLDFNGRNITTVSGGSFTITNGTAVTLANLGGRTITAAGDASFNGQSGNLLNLNPASGWIVAATGSLLADYSLIGGSTASVSPGTATSSTDDGGNANWTFQAALAPLMVTSFDLMPAVNIGEREHDVPGLRLVFRHPDGGGGTVKVTRIDFTMIPANPSAVVAVKKLRRKGDSTDHYSGSSIETSNPMRMDLTSTPLLIHPLDSDTFDVLFDVVASPSGSVDFTISFATDIRAGDSATGQIVTVEGDGVSFPFSSATGTVVGGTATPSGKNTTALLTEWNASAERIDRYQGTEDFYATWDNGALYFVWYGRDFESSGDLFIYLGTQSGGAGATWNYGAAGTHNLPSGFGGADYVVYYENAATNGLRDGAAGYAAATFTGSIDADEQTVSIRLPLVDIGSPDTVRIIAFVQNESTAGILASMPNDRMGEFTRNPTGSAPQNFISWMTVKRSVMGQTPVASTKLDSASVIHPTWSYDLGSGNYAAAMSVGYKVLYVSRAGSKPALICFNNNGTLRWKDSSITGEPTAATYYYESASSKYVTLFCEGSRLRAGYDEPSGLFNEFATSPIELGTTAGAPVRSIPPDGGSYSEVYAYAVLANGRVIKVFPETGGIIWTSPPINANPLAGLYNLGDRVYVGCTDGYLRSISVIDGSAINAYQASDSINTRPAYVSSVGTIYCTPKDDSLLALNSNLTRKWSYSVGATTYASPSYVYGSNPPILFCPAGSNLVSLRDSTTKAGLRWTYSTTGTISSDAVATSAAVYFASDDKRHFSVDVNTGAPRAGWPSAVLSQRSRTRIVIDNGSNSVYFGGGDAKVYRYPK